MFPQRSDLDRLSPRVPPAHRPRVPFGTEENKICEGTAAPAASWDWRCSLNGSDVFQFWCLPITTKLQPTWTEDSLKFGCQVSQHFNTSEKKQGREMMWNLPWDMLLLWGSGEAFSFRTGTVALRFGCGRARADPWLWVRWCSLMFAEIWRRIYRWVELYSDL